MTSPISCQYPGCAQTPTASGLCAQHRELIQFFVWALPRIMIAGKSIAEILTSVVVASAAPPASKALASKPRLLLPSEYVKK